MYANYGVFRAPSNAFNVDLLVDDNKKQSESSSSCSESVSESSSDADESDSPDVEEFKSERSLPQLEH